MNAIVETISQTELIELFARGSLRDTVLMAGKNGWYVSVMLSEGQKTLVHSSGSTHVFPSLDTAAALLHGIGVTAFRVDATAASFGPDIAYDAWFRQQVQESLDDPSPTIAHSEVEDMFAAKREALKRKMAGA
jgi:hypothetical protein